METDEALLDEILAAYELDLESYEAAGGTAGRAWRVIAGGRRWFVRQRGARTSGRQRVEFDHGLRKHLADHEYCTVAPMKTKHGPTWTGINGAVQEVYPWVEGVIYSDRVREPAQRTAAIALARLHELARGYEASCETLVPQYTSYPVPIEPRGRFDAPDAHGDVIEYIIDAYATAVNRAELERARDRAHQLDRAYAEIHKRLPKSVIHGDYNCFNLLFSPEGEVAGVFDFDWAWRETRLVDIGVGMFFFGARRRAEADASSIWALTRCPRFELPSMLEFLEAYHQVFPLSESEAEAIPMALLTRWISIRTEGVMKVPEERRAEFFLYGFHEPFDWFSRCEDDFKRGIDRMLTAA